jgi:hypothetical protein
VTAFHLARGKPGSVAKIRKAEWSAPMTTAIIGAGNIGGTPARHLVRGGEPVMLAAKDESNAARLAGELGPLPALQPSQRRSRQRTWPCSQSGSTR